MRTKKFHHIQGKMDAYESKELDTVNIIDIYETTAGIYTIGGSLGEILVSLLAFDEYSKKEKTEQEINKELVTSYLKTLLMVLKNKICFPKLRRKDIIDAMNTENPTVALMEAAEKGEEADELFDSLISN